MLTRAYSICRRCAAVYPAGRRCPSCDGDELAALAIAAATSHAIEQSTPPMRTRRNTTGLAVVALFALVLALGATVAAIAAPSRGYEPAPLSGSGSAAQVHE